MGGRRDDEVEEEYTRRRPVRRRGSPDWAQISVWAVALAAVGLLGLNHLALMRKAEGAVQEAAVAASAGAWFVAVYVVARGVEKVAAAYNRPPRRDD